MRFLKIVLTIFLFCIYICDKNQEINKQETTQTIFAKVLQNLDTLKEKIELKQKRYYDKFQINKKCQPYYNYWKLKTMQISKPALAQKQIKTKKPVNLLLDKVNSNKMFASWFVKTLKQNLKNTQFSKKIHFGSYQTIPAYIDYQDYSEQDAEEFSHFQSLPAKFYGIQEFEDDNQFKFKVNYNDSLILRILI